MKTLSKAGLLVAGVLAATAVPLTGTALAAPSDISSTITFTQTEAKQGDVCWGDTTPDPGVNVTGYTVQGTRTGIFPGVANGPGQWCASFFSLDAGKTYTFTVTAQFDSGPDAVVGAKTFQGYTLNGAISRKNVVAGSKVRFGGVLRENAQGPVVKNQPVQIQYRPAGVKTWRDAGKPVTTDSKGAWGKRFRPASSTKYRALFTKSGTMGSWTEQFQVYVHPALSLTFSRNPVSLGSKLVISGKVVAGRVAWLSGQRVSLQRLEKGKWATLRDLKISAKGTFRTRFTPGSRVDYKYRWITGGGPNYADGVSRAKTLVVS